MGGGIIQLVANGEEDIFLTRDPQITFFKVIYRRHTNCAREVIEQHFINDHDFGKRTTCIIAPKGDLIDKMTLKITLPAIPKFSLKNSNNINKNLSDGYANYANYANNDNNNNTNNNINNNNNDVITKFAWVRKIGYAMIKYIDIEINGKVIDTHYGEWLHIWSMLTTKNLNDNGLNILIGDVPELTNFTNGKDEYTLYIPLQFWFCRISGLALPMVSLQFSIVKINIEFYNIDECFILSPTHYIKCVANLANFKPHEYLIQKNNDNIERYGIFSHYDVINKRLYYTAITQDKFIGSSSNEYNKNIKNINISLISSISDQYSIRGVSSDFILKPCPNAKSFTIHHKSIKNTIFLKECVLLVDYVYLDDDERSKFAHTKHDYLIEQLYYTPNVLIDSTNVKVKLNIDHPCKLTVWLTQLDYISNFNDRFNYTNSHIRMKPYDIFHTCPIKIKLYDNLNIGDEIGSSLIEEEIIKLNSQERLTKRENKYFEFIQPLQHTINRLPRGCGMYSYSLFPYDTSPSGTTNMSQIELIELNLKLIFNINNTNKAQCRSYSLCYNIWRVDNGLSANVFVE